MLVSKATEYSENEEMYKLLMSGCVNMMNDVQRDEYKTLFGQSIFDEIMQKCHTMKQLEPLDDETDTLIDEIFDSLLDFRFDRNTDRAMAKVDKSRADTVNKDSTKYTILQILSNVLSDMKTWRNEDNLHEYKFLSKFENLVDLLLEDTGISASGGEGVSQATKRMAIINEYDCHFGRRCDSLIQGDDSGETANIEFKKANASTSVATTQQTKNIRINGCILNDINLITDSKDNTILYFDFVGRYGYLAQLFVYEGAYICQKYTAFSTPANMMQLDFFRQSLKTMFVWKSHSMKLHNKVRLARTQREHMYHLVDVSTSISPPFSPPRTVHPVQMYLSPSNGNKRSRHVFEEDK